MIMASPDAQTWYDKTHSATGLTITADNTFTLTDWAWGGEADANTPYFGIWIVPATYDFSTFVCEGAPAPASLVEAAVLTAVVDRRVAAPSNSPAPADVVDLVSPSPTQLPNSAASVSVAGGATALVASAAVLVVAAIAM